MRAVLVYKWARNVADAMVRSDGSIDWRNAKMTAGEDDPAALAAATRIAGDSAGEVVGLTIGDGDASWALARGVERAYSVSDAPNLTDNAATAAILAAAIRQLGGVDVVVIGDSRQDPGVAVALAGELGWPAMVGLESASVEGGRLLVTRKTAGRQQIVTLPTPAVIGIAAESDLDRVPGMKELLAARKRPLIPLTLAELGVTPQDFATRGCQRPASTPTRVFEGDPAEAVAQLVAALRNEGVL